jgi:TPP-dependent pyruvate/acetoin dehydrogenase alpha subunit
MILGKVTMPQLSPQFPAAVGTAEPWSLLAACSDLSAVDTSMSPVELQKALEYMKFSRAFDEKAFSLQRQGRFGTFSPVHGQEASVVGAAFALDPVRDWVVPQYRELPALLRQGLPLENFMLTHLGDPRGNAAPEGTNVMPIQIGLAAQLPQAVGLAWGLQRKGSDGVVLVFFGDGASSEGDFHEACNLAGTLRAPVVFFLQNNGWAISTPRSRQSAAANLAARAPGYGMPGIVVDGNDLLAVHEVVSRAVARARAGDGPSLVESVTYRIGDHNTADDSTRYRSAEEVASWLERDPIDRALAYLQARHLWDDEREADVRMRINERIDAAIQLMESVEAPGVDHLFEHVTAEPWSRLCRQRDALLAQEGAQ